MDNAQIGFAPIFPLYEHVKHCIRLWNGEKKDAVYGLIKEIFNQTGTPQNPVDWSEPDMWIAEKLTGEDRRIAFKIWNNSNNDINPRHMYGCHLFINRLKLLSADQGVYRLHERGQSFLDDNPELLNELDAGEGIPYILALASELGSFKFSDIIENWSIYLLAVSKFTKESVFRDSLRRRLLNLIDRGFISRESNRYEITNSGKEYLVQFPYKSEIPETTALTSKSDVLQAVRTYNHLQEEALKQQLMGMAPFEFEHFIKELLVAMEYENVEVTKQSGDKGVDVVANFQFGITEITEVVQVKRTEANIGRPVIDALRGALPYHEAIRGTVITLGGFAKDVEKAALYPGAAPITLIDGKQLIKLVIKHRIGIKSTALEVWDVDEAFFASRTEIMDEIGEG